MSSTCPFQPQKKICFRQQLVWGYFKTKVQNTKYSNKMSSISPSQKYMKARGWQLKQWEGQNIEQFNR